MKSHPRPASARDARHPIAVVAARTGLSQDVLRIWERRYGAVKPSRSPDGQRLYTDTDVERLRWLRLATEAGRAVGQIARLPSATLKSMVDEDAAALTAAPDSPDSARVEQVVAQALERTRELDGPGLEAGLKRAATLLGLSVFLEQIVARVLRVLGDEWHAGRLTVAQEHLASAVVQEVVIAAMRDLTGSNGAPRLVVATPSGERHAIGAALVGAWAAADGWNVVYLGADMPAEDIAASAIAAKARAVALSLVYVEDRERLLSELRALRNRLPADMNIVVGGAGAGAIRGELKALGVVAGGTLADLTDLIAPSRR